MVTCDLVLLVFAGCQLLVLRVIATADIGQARIHRVDCFLAFNQHVSNEQIRFFADAAPDVLNVSVCQLCEVRRVHENDVAQAVLWMPQRDGYALKARHRLRGKHLVFRSPDCHRAGAVRFEVDFLR